MAGNYGLKISKPGFNVKTCQPYELAFSSKYNSLKLHAEGTIERNITAPLTSIVTEVFTHNLGYPPIFFYRTIVPATANTWGADLAAEQWLNEFDTFRAYVDNTKFYIDCAYGSVGLWKHKYQIYIDKIT